MLQVVHGADRLGSRGLFEGETVLLGKNFAVTIRRVLLIVQDAGEPGGAKSRKGPT